MMSFAMSSLLSLIFFVLSPYNVYAANYEEIETKKIEHAVSIPGKIVFIRHVDGKHVFTFDGHTKSIKRLTHNLSSKPISYLNPKWSPDGDRITFTNSGLDHIRNIFVIRSDGSGFKQLTGFGKTVIRYNSLGWVDNNKVHFFCSEPNGKFKKGWYSLNIASGEKTKVTSPPEGDVRKVWNTEKTRYAVMAKYHDYYEIYDKDDNLIRKLVGGPLGEIYRWSPDSRWLLYCEGCEYEQIYPTLRLLNIDTGKSYKLTNGEQADWYYEIDGRLSSLASMFITKEYLGDKVAYDYSYLNKGARIEDEELIKLYTKTLRNEIFARHGRQFKSPELQYIFGVCDWYKPDPDYSDDMLNETERKNIQFILDYEKKMGWR